VASSLVRSLARALVYRAPGEAERCPACGSTDLDDLDVLQFRGRRFGFVSVCESCGLVFSNPQPSERELADLYGPEGAWGEGHGPPDELQKPKKRWRWLSLFDPIREELAVTAPPPGVKVLDFGCGSGGDLDVLAKFGWETYGIEPAVNHAFPRHRRLETIPEAPTFDLVLLNHVLEHVTHPLALLQQLARASRSGGYLLVGVPRFDTLPEHRDYRYVISGRAHVTAYTRSCLLGLLARAGWAPVAESDRRGTARLRVLARRVAEPPPIPRAPADEARAAVRAYYRDTDDRRTLHRLGMLRLLARRRQGATRARKPA
jgi:SAM-dependent methyltransferase